MNTSHHHSLKDNPVQMIQSLIHKKDLQSALQACANQLETNPNNANLWYLLSDIHLKAHNANKAKLAIEQALTLQPNHPTWQLHLAQCLLITQDYSASLKQSLMLNDLKTNNVNFHSDLALLFSRLEHYKQSEQHYQRALALEQNNASLHYNLATIHRFLGKIELAKQHLEKAISLNPFDYEAIALRSDISQQSIESNHINQLTLLIEKGINPPANSVQIHYALAKELEDIGESDKSFHYLKLGADKRRSYMQYSVETDIEIMEEIQQVYHPHLFENASEYCESNKPIFILGLPRTGSTLLERSLSNHSQIISAGELNNFATNMVQLANELSNTPDSSRSTLVKNSSKLDFSTLGNNYIASTSPQTDGYTHFIDKLPLNFLYIGLIHLALPNAKIIHLTRNPMDTCYAIYKKLFKKAYPFSYNLSDIGQYYIAYRKLMEHWYNTIPDAIFTVSYEDLITNNKNQVRQLIHHCELPWENKCIHFYNNTTASTTASATQVREPVYASSLGKWRRYQSQLKPLMDMLINANIDISDTF